MKEHIIVTGGAGYIGSHICKALANAGYIPVTVDNLAEGHRDLVKWGPFELLDILDSFELLRVFKRYQASAVMHLAGSAYIEESFKTPSKYYRNNVEGTLSVLDACKKSGCRRLIFSSSCTVYGIPQGPLITESDPCVPINPYGRTKFIAEQMIEDFYVSDGISFCGLRYFNAAGADEELETGEDHDPEPHLVPKILDVASGKAARFFINGDDFETADGTTVRDFIHVSDLAVAHVLALEYLGLGNKSDFFNLGAGRGVSVREVIHAAEKVTGESIETCVRERRTGDPAILIADPGAAALRLGFTATKSDIENILATAWAWYKLRRS